MEHKQQYEYAVASIGRSNEINEMAEVGFRVIGINDFWAVMEREFHPEEKANEQM